MRKKMLVITVVISMFVSHLPMSIFVVNAETNGTPIDDEYVLNGEVDTSDENLLGIDLEIEEELVSEIDHEMPELQGGAGYHQVLSTTELLNATSWIFPQSGLVDSCNVIAEGRFANQVGVNGIQGAPWVLCYDGALEVGEGFINWVGTRPGWSPSNPWNLSPWNNYRNLINRITFTGPITSGDSLNGLFMALENVTKIEGLEYFNTSSVTDMGHMFENTFNLTSLDLSSWDTSQVTNMSSMFSGIGQLANLDLSNWDTSQVTNMSSMFSFAGIASLDSLADWDTSNVTNMRNMFGYAQNLINLDALNWDTSSVTDMSWMFNRASNLTSLNLSTWDTSSVQDMSFMFHESGSLTNLDVSNWDTSSVRNMSHMFDMCQSSSDLETLDVSGWDTSNVTNMDRMFGNVNIRTLDVSGWNTSNVRTMWGVFAGASNLTSLNLSTWDTRNVTESWAMQLWGMDSMFEDTTSLRVLTLGENFAFRNNARLPIVSANTNFTGYWQNVGSGRINNPTGEFVFTSSQLMSQFDGQRMADTFVWQPINRPAVDLCETDQAVVAEGRLRQGWWDNERTGAPWALCDNGVLEVGEGFIDQMNVGGSPWYGYRDYIREIVFTRPIIARSTINHLFSDLTNVTSIKGLEYFDTSQVTNMAGTFFGLRNLRSLDLSSWDTSRVRSMGSMFGGSSALTNLDLSTWDTSQVTGVSWMFSGTRNLRNLDISTWDTSSVTDMSWMFQNASSLTSLDLSNFNTNQVRTMNSMFTGTTNLRQLTLGEDFRLATNAGLPTVRSNDEFTGFWQKVGGGTVDNPTGAFVFTSSQLMNQFDGSTMAGTFVWQPVNRLVTAYDITSLSIGGVSGVIDQEAATITFNIPTNAINQHGQFRGEITELVASSDRLIFFAGGQEWQLSLGQEAGVNDGDLVYVEGGTIYTIIIKHPELTITSLSIGGVAGVIDQEAATITFTVPASSIDGFNQFRGNITEFTAPLDTLIFFAGGQEWPLRLGESAGISTGNLVYVAEGRVYTIHVVTR